MPDTKISALTTITGANTATGDLFDVVDISDTTMAGSGTNKKLTRAELLAAMAQEGTTFQPLDSDLTAVAGLSPSNDDVLQRKSGAWANRTIAQLTTDIATGLSPAQGDIIIATSTTAIDNLAMTTAAGAAVVADPNAANKVSIQYPHGVEFAVRGTTSSLASTYDRGLHAETNGSVLTSGRIAVSRIFLPKGLSVTNIAFWSATTALSAGTNQWFGLFDVSLNKLCLTVDDTSTAWAANTKKSLAVTGGPYVTTTAGYYYLGILVVASTVPTLFTTAASGAAGPRNASPKPGYNLDTGLTNPASCPSTLTGTSISGVVYAEIS